MVQVRRLEKRAASRIPPQTSLDWLTKEEDAKRVCHALHVLTISIVAHISPLGE